MIDIHSHFLSGVDDGAGDAETTFAMLEQAQECGIRHLVASPHVNEHTTEQAAARIRKVFDDTREQIQKNGLSLEISLGAEVAYDPALAGTYETGWPLSGGEKPWLLFELPMFELPAGIAEFIFTLGMKNIMPVLAHPERNLQIRKDAQQLVGWVHQGCLSQLDAGSITGQFGNSVMEFAWRLLRARAVHIVGSDAHEPKGRSYLVLKEAFEMVSEKLSEKYARLLFETNPQNLIEGRDIRRFSIDESELQENFSQKLLRKLKIIR